MQVVAYALSIGLKKHNPSTSPKAPKASNNTKVTKAKHHKTFMEFLFYGRLSSQG